MVNENSISRATTPFQRYIFHFLPGLPVLVGTCIILWTSFEPDLNSISKIIQGLKLPSTEGLLGFTFFLVILILALGFVFLFGMIVDSIRHMVEEMFLVPKWSEYKIARSKELKEKWDIYDKIHETEYYYIEFFGNVAISLAFLWGVITWEYPEYSSFESKKWYFFFYILWTHLVFLLRPFFANAIWKRQEPIIKEWAKKPKPENEEPGNIRQCIRDWISEKKEKKKRETKIVKNTLRKCWRAYKNRHRYEFTKGFSHACINVLCFRVWDFSATFMSIAILFVLWILDIGGLIYIRTQAFHFYFIGAIMITTSFELYIVRFKRYREMLKALFLNSKETSE